MANDPNTIQYVIQEDGFWYIASKEKNPYVPELTVSAKGVANGLSTEYNDGYDFGPDTYDPTSTATPPYTQTSGIQEAINYVFNKGMGSGTVYGATSFGRIKLKSGIFDVSDNIVMPSHVSLIGSGMAYSTIRYLGTGQAIQIPDVNNSISYFNKLKGFSIYLGDSPDNTVSGVVANTISQSSFEDLSITDVGTYGIEISPNVGGQNLTAIRNCAIIGTHSGSTNSIGIQYGNPLTTNTNGSGNGYILQSILQSLTKGMIFGSLAGQILIDLPYFENITGTLMQFGLNLGNYRNVSNITVNRLIPIGTLASPAIQVNDDATDIVFNNPSLNSTSFNSITAGHLQVHNANDMPTGFAITTPALPTATGSANAIVNTFPYTIRIYQNHSTLTSLGSHIIDISGNDKLLPDDPSELMLDPGCKIYYATAVPASWIWYGA